MVPRGGELLGLKNVGHLSLGTAPVLGLGGTIYVAGGGVCSQGYRGTRGVGSKRGVHH